MIRDRAHRCRGKISPQTMFLAAGVILLVAALVALWAHRRGEEKKEEAIGRVGLQSKFKLGRHEGINLPVADQAKSAPSSPDTTLEVPLEWAKDIALAGKKLEERYAAIGAKLTKPAEAEAYGEAITLKVDRELEYRSLVQAVLAGRSAGFVKYRIACLMKGTEETVGYLDVELPMDMPKVLVFRLVKQDDGLVYVLGTSNPVQRKTLKGAMLLLEQAHNLRPDAVVEVMPSLELSVQNVIEGMNTVKAAGFTRITLARAKVD